MKDTNIYYFTHPKNELNSVYYIIICKYDD